MTASSQVPEPHLWITVLAGGVGSRFWPVSTPARPKQLLPLAGPRPIVEETVDRALSLVPPERVRILAGGAVADRIVEALPDLGPEALLREPMARGTAPVLVWAAHTLRARDPDAVLVSLHSDHVIEPLEGFRSVLLRAARVAREHGRLVTVGVVPDRPETGYGYLRPGDELADGDAPPAFRVERFVEKPDRDTAQAYVEDGYLWNSGIFIWKASVFLDEVARVAPEVVTALPLLDAGQVDEFFRACPTIQVDVAVLERSDRVATVRAAFAWDDVGSWLSLARTREQDPEGNVQVGDAVVVDGGDNIVFSEDGSVVLYGVDGLVAVRSHGITLVTRRELAPRLKDLLSRLPDRLKDPS